MGIDFSQDKMPKTPIKSSIPASQPTKRAKGTKAPKKSTEATKTTKKPSIKADGRVTNTDQSGVKVGQNSSVAGSTNFSLSVGLEDSPISEKASLEVERQKIQGFIQDLKKANGSLETEEVGQSFQTYQTLVKLKNSGLIKDAKAQQALNKSINSIEAGLKEQIEMLVESLKEEGIKINVNPKESIAAQASSIQKQLTELQNKKDLAEDQKFIVDQAKDDLNNSVYDSLTEEPNLLKSLPKVLEQEQANIEKNFEQQRLNIADTAVKAKQLFLDIKTLQNQAFLADLRGEEYKATGLQKQISAKYKELKELLSKSEAGALGEELTKIGLGAKQVNEIKNLSVESDKAFQEAFQDFKKELTAKINELIKELRKDPNNLANRDKLERLQKALKTLKNTDINDPKVKKALREIAELTTVDPRTGKFILPTTGKMRSIFAKSIFDDEKERKLLFRDLGAQYIDTFFGDEAENIARFAGILEELRDFRSQEKAIAKQVRDRTAAARKEDTRLENLRTKARKDAQLKEAKSAAKTRLKFQKALEQLGIDLKKLSDKEKAEFNQILKELIEEEELNKIAKALEGLKKVEPELFGNVRSFGSAVEGSVTELAKTLERKGTLNLNDFVRALGLSRVQNDPTLSKQFASELVHLSEFQSKLLLDAFKDRPKADPEINKEWMSSKK